MSSVKIKISIFSFTKVDLSRINPDACRSITQLQLTK